ncbi:hypothetical protein E2C01_022418 [Portunus trituberculatus]|uniref:Uncharacterized protein n=1 Tax=Portunus trituberculatus TaxID=210409 RepID=A0A5B7E784_PORTR|nr:hypothetical protein [Portunus trituberculatus]
MSLINLLREARHLPLSALPVWLGSGYSFMSPECPFCLPTCLSAFSIPLHVCPPSVSQYLRGEEALLKMQVLTLGRAAPPPHSFHNHRRTADSHQTPFR